MTSFAELYVFLYTVVLLCVLVCFNLLSNKQYVLGDYSTLICFKLLSAKQSYVLGDCPIPDITTYILSLLHFIRNI